MKEKLKTLATPLIVALGVCLGFATMWLCTNFISLMNGSDGDILLGIFGITAIATAIATTIALIAKRYAGRAVARVTKSLGGSLVLALALSGCVPGCERVDVGHVGIKVDMAGSSRGVQDVPIVTGYVFYNPLTQHVIEYPTFMQTASWASAKQEGDPNEEISFNSRDGLIITGDISLSYQLAAEKVPQFYVKFRSDDLTRFTHGYLRNVARDHFNEVAGTYAVEDLYGPKKEEFVHTVKDRINTELAGIGIHVEQFGFIGAPRPPQNVIAAINAKIAATQQAMQVENEVRSVQAQAQKNIADAEGKAKAAIATAEGQAASRIAVAEGEAKANAMLTNSITPTLLEWRRLDVTSHAVDKWDGHRPSVEGNSGGMLLQLQAGK